MKILAMEKELMSGTEVFRELYFLMDCPCAVLILKCMSVEEVQNAFTTLLLAKEGVIAFDLIPRIPYPGFSRLFY